MWAKEVRPCARLRLLLAGLTCALLHGGDGPMSECALILSQVRRWNLFPWLNKIVAKG